MNSQGRPYTTNVSGHVPDIKNDEGVILLFITRSADAITATTRNN